MRLTGQNGGFIWVMKETNFYNFIWQSNHGSGPCPWKSLYSVYIKATVSGLYQTSRPEHEQRKISLLEYFTSKKTIFRRNMYL